MRRLILCVAALRARARQPRGDRSAQPRLHTRTSGESVHWNDLCGSYEVRRSRHGEAFAVFLRAADVAAYCGAGLAALAAWAGDFDRVYFVLPAAADAELRVGAADAAAPEGRPRGACRVVDKQAGRRRSLRARRGPPPAAAPPRWRVAKCGAGAAPVLLPRAAANACDARAAAARYVLARLRKTRWTLVADADAAARASPLMAALAAADGARAAVVAGCAGDAAVALNRPALEAPCGEPTSRGACGNGTSAG
jgi:hypothetical protein